VCRDRRVHITGLDEPVDHVDAIAFDAVSHDEV
jgi:hypothetical protein